MSETSFLPRGLDHETMHEAADESAVKLSLLSGVGAGLGGPASSSNAIFVSTANRTPVCVVEAERRAAFELARKQAELRAAGSEPEYDHELVSVVQEIYISATKKYTLSIGKSVSKRERVETKLDDASFIYSEAEFEVMAVMLQKVKLRYGRPDVGFSGASGIMQSGGRFFDLGSGTGKPCIAALCLHSWAYVCGIEMLEGLYNTNLEMVAAFESKFGRALPEKVRGGEDQEIDLVLGDFMDDQIADWTSGDVVFANCTSYTAELMENITKMAEGMKVGAFVITVTKKLEGEGFQVVDTDVLGLSWGRATVFLQQRKPLEEEEEEEEEPEVEDEVEEEEEPEEAEQEDEVDEAEAEEGAEIAAED